MVVYGPVDVVLESIACGAVLLTSAVLAILWHPLLKQVRESCKAGIAHPDRDRLLHLVGLIPTAWGLALGIYIRNVYLIGCMMAEMPNEHFGHWVLSRLLDLYLFFVSFCGSVGLFVTIYYIYTFREDLKDLLMIIRFKSGAHRHLSDLELQRLSSGVVASPNLEDDNPPCRWSRDTDLHGSNGHRNVGDASQPQLGRPNPTWNRLSRNAFHMEQGVGARQRAYRRVEMESGGDELTDTPPSSPQTEANDNRHPSPATVSQPPSMVSDNGSDDPEPFREAIPRALRPQSDSSDGVDECPLSRCESCSETCSSTIPHAKRAAVREPLTPTSPTRDYGHAAMWSRLSSCQGGHVQADGAQQPLVAGLDAMPGELGDNFQDEVERYDRGQAIPAALALQRGTPIPPGPAHQLVYRYSGRSNVPQEMLPPARNCPRLPAPQDHPLHEVGSGFPSFGSPSYSRPTRVMADPRLVRMGGTDGHPTIARVASPRLRLEIPKHPSLLHSRTAAPAREDSLQRQQDRLAVEDWMLAQAHTRDHRYPPGPGGLDPETAVTSPPPQPSEQEYHSKGSLRAKAKYPGGEEP